MTPIILAALLVTLTGPDGRHIDVNAKRVVSTREPHHVDKKHIAEKIKCMVHTSDGKFIAVVEDCKTVRRLIEDTQRQ